MSWLFRRRPVVSFYGPDADAVFLVVEGYEQQWPMRRDRDGTWSLRLHQPYRDLHGRAYHFEVRRNGHSVAIADPFATRTEHRRPGLASLFSDLSYRFQHPRFRATAFRDIVIYETHLPALSRHASAEVEHESHRGTYAGARSPAVLAYLQRLRVAVEFLPLHAHDSALGQDWGYFSTSFRALRNSYALDKKEVNREVMAVVDAMHGRGIPVLLDVVFNHGGELLVKAWGEDVVYRRNANGDFCQGSGCGPTIRTEHPLVRESILETLEQLVNDYRFDGFRFDLGALHDKQTMLEIDRRLPERIYLIAEPWALGGAQWGKGDMSSDFGQTRWAVWNDDFRETGKTFLRGRGDHHNRDRLMCAIAGSHVDDGGWALRPQQCINYVSSHDGKTLADFVEGNKHRVLLGVILVLTAQGVPMLGEGTELMFSKQGHDNSYDRPDLNQIDWGKVDEHQDLVDAVTRLIALRRQLPHFRHRERLRSKRANPEGWDIDWIYPTGYPHHDNVNAIGFVLRPPSRRMTWRRSRQPLVILLNGSQAGADFQLPKGTWKVLVDGHRIAVDLDGLRGIPHALDSYHSHPGTGAVLAPV
jgi:pullulanase